MTDDKERLVEYLRDGFGIEATTDTVIELMIQIHQTQARIIRQQRAEIKLLKEVEGSA